jgi:hypothetical protein
LNGLVLILKLIKFRKDKIMGTKETEIMYYLKEKVFNPILNSEKASTSLKQGVRMTISRLEALPASSMVKYYWSSIIGTEKSPNFAKKMKDEGFIRFEELIEEFRLKFNDEWLRSK